MHFHFENSAKRLRDVANELDKVWKDCRIACAAASGATTVGCLLSIFGTIATIMTAGAAGPLAVAGFSIGAAGTLTKLGTLFVEPLLHSSIVQEADEVVQNAHHAIENVKMVITGLKIAKSDIHLVFLAGLAIRMLGKDHLLVAFLKDVVRSDVLAKALPSVMKALPGIKELAVGTVEKAASAAQGGLVFTSKHAMSLKVGTTKWTINVGAQLTAKGTKLVSGEAGNTVMKSGTEAVTKTAAKKAAKFIIGAHVAFLVLDAIDLAFTVRDIVENQGSDAARILRCKADEFEARLNKK
ncbi:uncharacterized protein LOC114961817 [Acropora millepora]|uniref:uncharacterized protein LOC114961817 n=1 Tax=Acropora millepora TaxID=45264 RepID=UPI001CF3EC15|nr:uncharacterized protein LOC114961817 [Acropora millepora]